MLQIVKKYSDIIASYRVHGFEQFGALFRLRAEIEIIDGSQLYIRETVIHALKRKYAYPWQDKHQMLIVRWDNAPDWDVETFPHHRHVGKKENVEPSYERTLEQVMAVIAEKVRKK
ncbi:MAG: hypothetical protein J7J91_01540 [Deltaproteobacteria bacterium]|nr:hypothetical protein [Deltaproteobacteria bacterium]